MPVITTLERVAPIAKAALDDSDVAKHLGRASKRSRSALRRRRTPKLSARQRAVAAVRETALAGFAARRAAAEAAAKQARRRRIGRLGIAGGVAAALGIGATLNRRRSTSEPLTSPAPSAGTTADANAFADAVR